MRTLVVLVGVLVMSGCGEEMHYVPPGPATKTCWANIENDYAVSLFSLVVHITGPTKARDVSLFADTRIEGASSAKRDFTALPGDKVTLDFSSTSLGTGYTVPTVTDLPVVSDANSTIRIIYDYDLATARFGIKTFWAR